MTETLQETSQQQKAFESAIKPFQKFTEQGWKEIKNNLDYKRLRRQVHTIYGLIKVGSNYKPFIALADCGKIWKLFIMDETIKAVAIQRVIDEMSKED